MRFVPQIAESGTAVLFSSVDNNSLLVFHNFVLSGGELSRSERSKLWDGEGVRVK